MRDVMRILVADGSVEYARLMKVCLSDESGIEVVGTVDNGIDALIKLAELRPDVLVMDVMLPRVDGLEVLRKLPDTSPETTPIIVSGFIDDRVIAECAAVGVKNFLLKPCEINTLTDRIERIRRGEGETSPTLSAYRSRAELESVVTDILQNIGIPASIKGYKYLREAIVLAVYDADMIAAVTKLLYPAVAKKFGSTPSRVERAIRHAIEVAWDRGDIDVLQNIFGHTVSGSRGKPTNSEFIAMIADRLKLKNKLGR